MFFVSNKNIKNVSENDIEEAFLKFFYQLESLKDIKDF